MPVTYSHTDPAGRLPVEAARYTVPAGEAVLLRPWASQVGERNRQSWPWTVRVAPVTGGTARVEISISDPTLDLDDYTWDALDADAATAQLYSYPSPVSAIRVQAFTEDALVEFLG